MASADPSTTPDHAPGQAELLWDSWGVPHIYGADLPALMYGFGWAQASGHGNRILRLYGEARGRSAEYWGGGPAALAQDLTLHTFDLPELGQDWYERQSAPFRAGLDAFAAGFNAFAAAHPEDIDPALAVVLPVQASDVLAHAARVAFEFLMNNSPECGALRPTARLDAAAGRPGSNGWAIGPAKSADGSALLLINPHLPWSPLFTLFEAQLLSPEINAYGAALVGLPVLTVGFNDRLGWTHTVNTHDGCDAYILTPSGEGYLLDGIERAFEQRSITLRQREVDGSLSDHPFTIRRSVHGPVLGEQAGRPVAVRMVGVDQFPVPGGLEQWWDMARARSLAEFEAVLARLQLPMLSVLYADADGHILHLFGGQVPRRPFGDWSTWSQPVAGDTRATLWTELHPYDDLPRAVDPPSGWLQNSNSPPWHCSLPSPLDPADYPPYMAPRGLLLREQRALRLLDESGLLSLAEMATAQSDNLCLLADRVLEVLLVAAEASGDARALAAVAVLRRWDRKAGPASRGMALFFYWVMIAQQNGGLVFAAPWDPAQPTTTPRGLANPTQAVAALVAAADQLARGGAGLDVPWGAAARLRVGNVDVPVNGGPGEPFGIFQAMYLRPAADGRLQVVGGETFVAAVSFAVPVRAMVRLAYGNSSQLGSAHHGDQAELAAEGQLRRAWLTRDEVLANLARREVLSTTTVDG